MRRDLNEIETEILRRRDEYRQKKAARARTMKAVVPSALAAVMALTLVIALPVLKRSAKTNGAMPGEDPEYKTGSATDDGSSLPDGSAVAGSYSGGAPGSTELPGVEGPGPWICGTPFVNGKRFEWLPGEPISEESGGGILIVVHEDGSVSVPLGKADAASLIGHILCLEDAGKCAEIDENAAFMISLDFNGSTLNVLRFQNGTYLVNRYYYCRLNEEADAAFVSLIDSIESAWSASNGR